MWLLDTSGPAVAAWVKRHPGQVRSRLLVVFVVTWAILALPVFGMAAYFWRIGSDAVRTAEFPPPGTLLIQDAELLRGEPAVRRGRIMQIVSGCFVALALAATVLLWRLYALAGFS
jgi:hypothetical protein